MFNGILDVELAKRIEQLVMPFDVLRAYEKHEQKVRNTGNVKQRQNGAPHTAAQPKLHTTAALTKAHLLAFDLCGLLPMTDS